jgi:HPt (histidine-containing phosphotransfer) domain-containing protein
MLKRGIPLPSTCRVIDEPGFLLPLTRGGRFAILSSVLMENKEASYELLDLSQVNMILECGGDEAVELFNEILELFEEESRVKLQDLNSAKAAGEGEAFSNAAHALAGSGANIGGKAVWLMAKDMENLSRKGEITRAFGMLTDLEGQFEATLRQLRQYVRSVTAGES